MRRIGLLAGSLLLLLVVAGCGGGGDRTPTPGSASSAPLDTLAAFQTFSGLSVPASAVDVTLQVTSAFDQPAYRVSFRLPSADLDAFCRSGRLDIPLRVVTVPQDYRDTFDYRGDSSTGVAVTSGSLPADPAVQRKLFAVDTSKKTAKVQVYAFQMPN